MGDSMDKNKIIILSLIAIIIALLVVGAILIMPNFNKADTKLTFESESAVTEGDSIKIKLTDDNGTALANQTVKITFTDKDNSKSNYSVATDYNGIGELKLDEDAGKYNVTITYEGNDMFNGCNATKKITIEEKVVQAELATTSNDPGAYYSQQAMRTIYTGEVMNTPGGPMRHLGNNKWEPA